MKVIHMFQFRSSETEQAQKSATLREALSRDMRLCDMWQFIVLAARFFFTCIKNHQSSQHTHATLKNHIVFSVFSYLEVLKTPGVRSIA